MTHPKKPREESYQQARAVYEFLKRPDVNVIETLARNIDTAERRGFERAKRMACKKAEDFDAYKRPCLNKAHDSSFCGYCRYEEEAK